MAGLIDALNKVQYAGYDFDTFLDELRARTQTKFPEDFNDFSQSGLGMVLFDHIAFGLDSQAFYLDRRATETFLETARTRTAIAKLARQLGYKLTEAVSASVDLRVTLNQTYAFPITIPAGFQFKTSTGIIFEASESVTFPTGDVGPKTVPAYQGETTTESFVSDGTANQKFQLRRVSSDKQVVRGKTSCVVDGAVWIESEFVEVGSNDQYEVSTNEDPPSVRFGDGIAGNIPATGASIVVTYVISVGKAGRVEEGAISKEKSPLVVSFTNISLTVTNPEGAVGGDDSESLDHARSYAGRVWKSRDVAVTQQDYEALAGSFSDPVGGKVAVAKAYVSRTATEDTFLQNAMMTIHDAVAEPVPIVSAQVLSAQTALDEITDSLATISTLESGIATKTTEIDSYLQASMASARTTKNLAVEIQTDAGDINTTAVALEGQIDTIGGTGISDSLTLATYNAIKALIGTIRTEAGLVTAAGSNVVSDLSSQLATQGSARDSAAAIGLNLTTSGTLLYELETERSLIAADVTAVETCLATIEAAVTDTVTTVDTALDEIEAHVASILSDDCSTNLVTVPILSYDAGGFYVGPSTLLRQQLQTFLDARKEVTQVVEVVSAERFLIPAVISVRIGVLRGYPESVIATAVIAATEAVLRNRSFGVSLRLDELYRSAEQIEGIGFVNFSIAGHLSGSITDSSKVDSDGNLVVDAGEVVTKGTISVGTEEYSEA